MHLWYQVLYSAAGVWQEIHQSKDRIYHKQQNMKQRGVFEMGFCKKCGSELKGNAEVCPVCGAVQDKNSKKKKAVFGEKVSQEFDEEDIQENKVAAVLAYLGILIVVPLFLSKDSKFARFHAGQGLAVLLASIGYQMAVGVMTSVLTVLSWRFYYLTGIMRIAGAAFMVLSAMGIMNAVNGEARELPVIGKWKLLK